MLRNEFARVLLGFLEDVLGEADVDPVEIVLAQEFLPIAHERLIHRLGHGEDLDAEILHLVLVHFVPARHFLFAMAAMRIPEDEHDVFLRQIVETDPFLFGGIGKDDVGRLASDHQRRHFACAFAELFQVLVAHPVRARSLVGRGAVVVERHVHEHGVHAHDLAVLVFVGDELHHVLEHVAAVVELIDELIGELVDRVGRLRHHFGDVFLQLVMEDRNAHDALVLQIEIVPEMRSVLVVGS